MVESRRKEVRVCGPGVEKGFLRKMVWKVIKDFQRVDKQAIAFLSQRENLEIFLMKRGCVAVTKVGKKPVSVVIGMPNLEISECNLTVATAPEVRKDGNFRLTCGELIKSCLAESGCPISRVVMVTENPAVIKVGGELGFNKSENNEFSYVLPRRVD